MEYVLLSMVIAVIGYYLYQGYADATRAPPALREVNGVRQPICARCQAQLIAVTRKQGGGLADVAAIVLGLLGVVVLLAHWIAGAVILLLALLLHFAGKSTVTALVCPACGQEDRLIR